MSEKCDFQSEFLKSCLFGVGSSFWRCKCIPSCVKIIRKGTWGSHVYLNLSSVLLVWESRPTQSILMGLDWILFCEASLFTFRRYRQWLIRRVEIGKLLFFIHLLLSLGKVSELLPFSGTGQTPNPRWALSRAHKKYGCCSIVAHVFTESGWFCSST